MPKLVVARNVVNLYAEATSSSKIVTQAILGDIVEPIRTEGRFSWVATSDRYNGWIADDDLVPDFDRSDFLTTTIATLFAEIYDLPDPQAQLITKLVVSSRVTLAHGAAVGGFVPLVLPDKTIGYVHSVGLDITHDQPENTSELADPKVRRSIDIDALRRQIIRSVGARAVDLGGRFIGTPYLWGGCTPFGIDCSGFVQLSYKLSGLQLLRDADLQFKDRRFERCDRGQSLDESDLLAGDLVAFCPSGRNQPAHAPAEEMTHIGMATGDGRFIHSLSGHGVVMEGCASERFAAQYAGAVRLSPNANLAIDTA